MKLIKRMNELNTYDLFLEDDSKRLSLMFGGNGDLYWLLSNKKLSEEDEYHNISFSITKENYAVYKLFVDLYNDIKNINLSYILNKNDALKRNKKKIHTEN